MATRSPSDWRHRGPRQEDCSRRSAATPSSRAGADRPDERRGRRRPRRRGCRAGGDGRSPGAGRPARAGRRRDGVPDGLPAGGSSRRPCRVPPHRVPHEGPDRARRAHAREHDPVHPHPARGPDGHRGDRHDLHVPVLPPDPGHRRGVHRRLPGSACQLAARDRGRPRVGSGLLVPRPRRVHQRGVRRQGRGRDPRGVRAVADHGRDLRLGGGLVPALPQALEPEPRAPAGPAPRADGRARQRDGNQKAGARR